MTANTTEQERALFEAVASDDGKWPQAIERDAKGNYLLLTTANGWMWWQAARRAPAVPQGWDGLTDDEKDKAVSDIIDYGIGFVAPLYAVIDNLEEVLRSRNTAAPQPLEVAQLDDINVVDMAQAVDSKEAAPVQLPEPVAKIDGGSLKWHIPDAGYSLPVRYLQGTQMLYTEQQVRQLLAAHGIEEQQ